MSERYLLGKLNEVRDIKNYTGEQIWNTLNNLSGLAQRLNKEGVVKSSRYERSTLIDPTVSGVKHEEGVYAPLILVASKTRVNADIDEVTTVSIVAFLDNNLELTKITGIKGLKGTYTFFDGEDRQETNAASTVDFMTRLAVILAEGIIDSEGDR